MYCNQKSVETMALPLPLAELCRPDGASPLISNSGYLHAAACKWDTSTREWRPWLCS